LKPTLFLLPGLNCDAAVWAPQIELLQSTHTCIVPDWGLLNALSDMAVQVLQSSPSETFCLAGHSMGGRVACELMRLAPQRIERLALLDTGTHPLPTGEAADKERAGRFTLLDLAKRSGMRAMAAQWAQGMVHPDHLQSEVFSAVLDMIERGSAEQFEAQIMALLNRPDAGPLMSAIQCPTLVLCGREDGWSPPAQHVVMAGAIRAAGNARVQLEIIETCGHMCTIEQPMAVNQALLRWLS
jgi:pimeloyl-ACP methyl ester carboxylesterase